MTADKFKEDFEYVYNALKKHPLILTDEQKRVQFDNLYQDKKEKQFTYDYLIEAITDLTTFFHDGHTNIELPYTYDDYCLNISCKWSEQDSDVLVLSKKYEDLTVDTEIFAVENMTVNQIIKLISDRIPHENTYLVKSRMINYPYKNYHVFSEMNLTWLFGKKESYEITFMVNGQKIKKQCKPTVYDGFLDFNEDCDFVSYEICGKTAILHLNYCIFNEFYKSNLEELAYLCEQNNVSSLVLDLSKNMGGSSAVIDEFISYTNIDNYRRYEMIDYSSGEPKYVTKRTGFVVNQKKKILFPPDIYCKVSHDTFSSARTFAVTLKDNGIAKIIGTETGGKPSSYGMPQKSRTPNCDIGFRVSRCMFLRPNEQGDIEITLTPDSIFM